MTLSSPWRRLGSVCVWFVMQQTLLGCAVEENGADIRSHQQAAVPQTFTIRIDLPGSAMVGTTAIGARESLKIGDGVAVSSAAETPWQIVNNGGGAAEVGADAVLGTPQSPVQFRVRGAVSLADRTRINGNLTANGQIRSGNGVTVTGTTSANTPSPAGQALAQEVTFSGNGAPLHLEPNRVATVGPGNHGAWVVKPSARLRLTSGYYFVESLDVHSGAIISLEDAVGPVIIYTRGETRFRGTIQGAKAPTKSKLNRCKSFSLEGPTASFG